MIRIGQLGRLGQLRSCETVTVTRPGEGRLASSMGMRRGIQPPHPLRLHAGTDIGVSRGTTIYAPRAGIVERVTSNEVRGGPFNGYGNAVVLRHEDERSGPKWSFYAHTQRTLVTAGQYVEPGTPIAEAGNTTNGKFRGMGVHLHMEVRHAKPDGSSPYPGPYGRYNEDPEDWLRSHGVTFVDREWSWDPARGACAAPGGVALAASSSPAAGTFGLARALGRRRRLGDVDVDAEYEPVLPENGFFKGTPLGLQLAGGLVLGGIGLFGLVLTIRSL